MREYKLKSFILLVFSVSILFLFTFNVTTSRYMEEFKEEAEDVVAIPVISLENPTFNYAKENVLPGYTTEADFYVSNYDEAKQNEVLMKYYLKIKLETEIPVKVTLTDEEGRDITLTEEGRTEEYELPYDTRMRTKYHIKLEWNENDNSYEYAGKSINLTIDLIAVQVVEGKI